MQTHLYIFVYTAHSAPASPCFSSFDRPVTQIHELAGVVAAGNAAGEDVATVAIVTKLVRVCMLAPMLMILSAVFPSIQGETGPGTTTSSLRKATAPPPWFILAFFSVTSLNTAFNFNPALVKAAGETRYRKPPPASHPPPPLHRSPQSSLHEFIAVLAVGATASSPSKLT